MSREARLEPTFLARTERLPLNPSIIRWYFGKLYSALLRVAFCCGRPPWGRAAQWLRRCSRPAGSSERSRLVTGPLPILEALGTQQRWRGLRWELARWERAAATAFRSHSSWATRYAGCRTEIMQCTLWRRRVDAALGRSSALYSAPCRCPRRSAHAVMTPHAAPRQTRIGQRRSAHATEPTPYDTPSGRMPNAELDSAHTAASTPLMLRTRAFITGASALVGAHA